MTTESTSRAMRSNRRTDTRPELALRSELHRRGLRFRKDFPVTVAGHRARPDVVFTRARVAVFVDGCFWHSCPDHGRPPNSNKDYWGPKLARNVERDRIGDEALSAAGWAVVRVWEHTPSAQAAELVLETLRTFR